MTLRYATVVHPIARNRRAPYVAQTSQSAMISPVAASTPSVAQLAERVGLDVTLGVGGGAEEDREHLADHLLLEVGLLEAGDPLALELDQSLPDLVGVGIEPGRDLLVGARGGDGDPGQPPHLHQVVLHPGDRAVAQLGQRGSFDGGVLGGGGDVDARVLGGVVHQRADDPPDLAARPVGVGGVIGPALGGQGLGLLLERICHGGGGGDLGLQVGDLVVEALIARQHAAAGGGLSRDRGARDAVAGAALERQHTGGTEVAHVQAPAGRPYLRGDRRLRLGRLFGPHPRHPRRTVSVS